MLYLLIILGGTLLIGLLNQAVLTAVLATGTAVALDGVSAFLIRRLPESWYAPGGKRFRVGRNERRFYRKLGIKKWKKWIPELGGFTGFHKDQVRDPQDPAYLYRFLLESNYGVEIHLWNGLLGLLVPFLPWCGGFAVGWPVAIVNLILSLLPAILLRYNTLPLLHLYQRAKRAGDS